MLLVGDFIPQRLSVRLPDEFSSQTVLANLEGPICEDGLPVSNKVGICLHTTSTETLFDSIKTFAFSLANNHLMDFREEGLRQTQEALGRHEIPCAGAGEDEVDARKPMILDENGMRVAVFACCERQYGMAALHSAGVAEMGVWLYEAIRSIKSHGETDRVIVSCHAASEFCPWPSPQLREFYHSLIDAGADVIHGHHSHVPQGWEVYKGKPIFFGLGNFVVDTAMWSGNRNMTWSLVPEIRFSSEGDTFNVMLYHVSSDKNSVTVNSRGDNKFEDAYLEAANAPFGADSRVSLESVWQEAAICLYPRIYSQGIRAPGVARRHLSMRDRARKVYFAIRDLGYALCGREWATKKSIYYAKCLYSMYNCRSHYEMISTALGALTKVEPDLRSETSRQVVRQCMEMN